MLSLIQWLTLVDKYEHLHVSPVNITLKRRSSYNYLRIYIRELPSCTRGKFLINKIASASVYEGDTNES